MTKYTAADFANAQFAKHERGEFAARICADDFDTPWASSSDEYFTDEEMVLDEWVPVPTKPTITSRRYQNLVNVGNRNYQAGFNVALTEFGIEIVDDPEPTDEELLAGIIRNIDDWQAITSPELLAKYLNTAGVTPPKENTK